MDSIFDSLIWVFDSSGEFSVKSFRKCMEDRNAQGGSVFKEVWLNICPPKIELFVWQLLHGRVLVREVLSRFGIQVCTNLECPFCQSNEESVDHLFLHCKWTWGLWQKCINWWGLSYYAASTLLDWWRGWRNLCTRKKSRRAWMSLFFAVVWSIWEARNQLIFKDIPVDSVRMEDMVRFRVGWWFKHFGGGSLDPLTLILLNIVDRCSEISKKSFFNLQKWISPATNLLKFNVDGSVRSSLGFAGICGVLRNHLGKDVISAEILVIARACDLFGSRPDLVRWRLIIACDSKSVVEWQYLYFACYSNLFWVDSIVKSNII
ncbi:hypothetical protein Ddye_022606 [Dipteronia dyeriana]|uniref:Reverse transcriptase zinc-binding domain-containing protein n=1 Tax=Dipteronia dyeriana TaxID=168575 RepID=A0AAD9TRW3_9ROSI|nr:hypothetical protein Ddye_022606 [Dipteronia dyeriana]